MLATLATRTLAPEAAMVVSYATGATLALGYVLASRGVPDHPRQGLLFAGLAGLFAGAVAFYAGHAEGRAAIVTTVSALYFVVAASGFDGFGHQGVPGSREFAADLPTWQDLEDPSWTARFAYQNVERRGTGGGAFRRMYAEFLDEAVDAVPLPADAPDRMHDIAADWTALGEVLREASEADGDERATLFAEDGERASDLADREERLYEDLRAAV